MQRSIRPFLSRLSPLVSAVCILLAASCLNRSDAWLWGGIHILLTAALPTLYIVYLYHRGE